MDGGSWMWALISVLCDLLNEMPRLTVLMFVNGCTLSLFGMISEGQQSPRLRMATRIQQLVVKKLREARMQLLALMKDVMNLSTSQKSVVGGGMRPSLSPELQRPDCSNVMEPRERNWSRVGSVRKKHQSMEDIITFQEEPSSP